MLDGSVEDWNKLLGKESGLLALLGVPGSKYRWLRMSFGIKDRDAASKTH